MRTGVIFIRTAVLSSKDWPLVEAELDILEKEAIEPVGEEEPNLVDAIAPDNHTRILAFCNKFRNIGELEEIPEYEIILSTSVGEKGQRVIEGVEFKEKNVEAVALRIKESCPCGGNCKCSN